MRRMLALGLTLGSLAVSAATVNHADWFPFQVPWDDTSANATNLAAGIEAPAGRRGFVQVGSDGRFRYQDGTRARFAGFVSVAQANMPDSADAPQIAAHLRRYGVNLMRVHLTDVEGAYGFFLNSSKSTRELDPAKMRRFDWFQKCLRDQGIYVNFCVQAGRVFKTGDGIPAPVTNDQSKFVSLFDPVMIALQKELATTLATHVNAFTGLAYKDDPAVVSWELTNENQLFMGWVGWGSSAWDSTSTGGMASHYVRELDTLWNGWLVKRYGTDAALAAAWAGAVASATNLVKNPSFETNTSGWGWWADATKGAGMRVKRVAGGLSGSWALQVTVDSQGVNPYDASVNCTGMSVSKGRSYRLRFAVKGSEPTTVMAEFLKESVWTWYGSTTCPVDTSWSVCESFLTAPADIVDSLRFNVSVGRSSGTLLIDSAELVEYGGDGLRSGESLPAVSVRRSSRGTVGALSDARARDEARFYADLEGRYLDTLRTHLKGPLGIKVPVTFTNNWYGLASIASQSRGDYLDAHWYWQHPNFPNGWSATDYTIGNTPMVKDQQGGTVAQFSLSRVAGKPFVGSEYNHPFPNQYLCEAPAFYFGYMGFLDADGAILHAYADYDKARYKETWNVPFFSVATNPVLMTQLPLMHLFRSGRIAAATVQHTVDVAEKDWTLSPKRSGDGFPFAGSTASLAATPMRWGRFDADTTVAPALPDPGSKALANTGELSWDRTAGILAVDNPFWQGAVGFLKPGVTTAKLQLSGIKTTGGRDFAAVHLVSVDSLPVGKSRKMLLLTSARLENQSSVWNASYTAMTTPFKKGDTTVCEPVWGNVTFDAGRRDSVSVYALDMRGNRLQALSLSKPDDSTSRFTLTLPGTTLWYEVAIGETASPIGVGVHAAGLSDLGIRAVRKGGRSFVEWSAPGSGRLEAEILDAKGARLGRFEANSSSGNGELELAGRGLVLVRIRLSCDGSRLLRTFPLYLP